MVPLYAVWLAAAVYFAACGYLRRPVGLRVLRAAAEGALPSRRRARAAQRRVQGIREQLQRHPYPAGWAQVLPADVSAALTGWPGEEGAAVRRFLCHHWQLTYDIDALVELRPIACADCGSRDIRTHDYRCPTGAPCELCRLKGGRHEAWCKPDGKGGRIARGTLRESISYDRNYEGGRMRAVVVQTRNEAMATFRRAEDYTPVLHNDEFELVREACECRTCTDRQRMQTLSQVNRYLQYRERY